MFLEREEWVLRVKGSVAFWGSHASPSIDALRSVRSFLFLVASLLLLVTSASLVVTSALLLVTKSY